MFRFLAILLLPVRRAFSPPAPGRFEELTQLFRIAFPDADAERWEAHCEQLAAAAYWEGERRGWDRARGLDEAALRDRHDWTLSRGRKDLGAALRAGRDPDDPLSQATPEQRRQVEDAIAAGISFELIVTPEPTADRSAVAPRGEDPTHAGIPRRSPAHPRSRRPA